MRPVPSFFSVVTMAVLCSCSSPEGTERASANVNADSAAMIDTARSFFAWYKATMPRLNEFHLVNQQEGTPYSVDSAGCEAYLGALRESGLVTEGYLAGHRAEFRQYADTFRITPQTEGPPYGFDMDLVMLSQEPEVDLDSVPHAKVVSQRGQHDTGWVDITLFSTFDMRLVRSAGNWKVDRIEPASDR